MFLHIICLHFSLFTVCRITKVELIWFILEPPSPSIISSVYDLSSGRLAQLEELADFEVKHEEKMSTTCTEKLRVPTNIRPRFLKATHGLSVERKLSFCYQYSHRHSETEEGQIGMRGFAF